MDELSPDFGKFWHNLASRHFERMLTHLVIKDSEHYDKIVPNCKYIRTLGLGEKLLKPFVYDQLPGDEQEMREICSEKSRCIIYGDRYNNPIAIDTRVLAAHLSSIVKLEIGPGVELVKLNHAPPMLNDLKNLEELTISTCVNHISHYTCDCDYTRDEWSLRILAQNSRRLRYLDVRGCFLKIMSLGWLKTERLEELHMFHQVPAASILAQWYRTLKVLTLSHVSRATRSMRSMGPTDPREELDACLYTLSRFPKLRLLDLKGSEHSLDALQAVIDNTKSVESIQTGRPETGVINIDNEGEYAE